MLRWLTNTANPRRNKRVLSSVSKSVRPVKLGSKRLFVVEDCLHDEARVALAMLFIDLTDNSVLEILDCLEF
jgi:hypothetical protein